MTEEIIKLLLPEIQASCPENVRLSIRKIPLNNVRALYLLIIQYNTNITDVEEWAIYEVYHRYHKISVHEAGNGPDSPGASTRCLA